MWRKIQTAMQHDSTLVGFYNEQFLARQREDPNLTYDQWLDIKVREEIETKKFEEAGGAYGLDVAAPFQIRVEGNIAQKVAFKD
ncbi:unnamed protein product [Cylicostephanus goldi]|uniref:Uncharacterized protein n=1 Tax=Cylicostephanus goldi TaxID=71465 RepID=A0A3P6RLF9_CYLGO|nr:unnamed protein product [Cylicostephanus goldi]